MKNTRLWWREVFPLLKIGKTLSILHVTCKHYWCLHICHFKLYWSLLFFSFCLTSFFICSFFKLYCFSSSFFYCFKILTCSINYKINVYWLFYWPCQRVLMPGLGGLLKLSNVIERYIFGLCFIIVCRIDDGFMCCWE